MKELSLYILDITENSVRANATSIELSITEQDSRFTLEITDNGCGMSEETLQKLSNPFFTTRTTRKVGLGVPFLTLAAEQTGGGVHIESRQQEEYPENHGTRLKAVFDSSHIDFVPLGDIVATMITLIQGNPEIDFLFVHSRGNAAVRLDTRELREVLGEVPLNSYEVLEWIKESLKEQYGSFDAV